MKTIIISLVLLTTGLVAAEFQVGVARKVITPPLPYWLTGYAARTNPAASVRYDLHAKALAFQDAKGGRVVLVTTDLIGLPRDVSEKVAESLRAKYGLQRSQLLLNSSHTHCGPSIWTTLRVMYSFDEAENDRVIQYTRQLTDDLTEVAGNALKDLAPATLATGHGSAGFAINRRKPTDKGFVIGENPTGPTDHDVPVLEVKGADGKLRAVLFGYSCHNTTLGATNLQIHGDYAGVAQHALEAAHPGTTALFMMLCGGDQNPSPRGTLELVEQHGKTLATAVDQVLAGKLKPVHGPIRTAHLLTQLELAPHTRKTFEADLTGANPFKQRRAKFVLEGYDQGKPMRQVTYPVQAVRFNTDLSFLALGGEVVVDYGLRAKREFPRENLVVSGYCNDVMCYIPTVRILREGGYEAVDSMIYYGKPGPFAESVEETIFKAIHEVMGQAGAGR